MIWIIGFILFILLLGIKFNIKLTYNKLIFKKIIVIVTTTYALYTIYYVYLTMHNSIEWYYTLKRPVFQPASWVFSVVWSYIYVSWFLAIFYIYSRLVKLNFSKVLDYLLIFTLNASVQSLWVRLFNQHKLYLSLFPLILSLLSSFLLIYFGNKIARFLAYILTPQFVWLIMATSLGYQTYVLNS